MLQKLKNEYDCTLFSFEKFKKQRKRLKNFQ